MGKESKYVKKIERDGLQLSWIIFIVFALILFVKTMLFHFITDQTILLSSCFRHPTEFLRFWNGKILPSLVLGSFVFLSKRYWWTIIANILIDIWIVANIFYYKANSLFITYDSMKLMDNMTGFWDSLLLFLNIEIWIFLVITLVYTIGIIVVDTRYTISKEKSWRIFGVIFLMSICLSELNMIFFNKEYKSWQDINSAEWKNMNLAKCHNPFRSFFPFGYVYYSARTEDYIDANEMSRHYVRDNSIISYFPACLLFKALQPSNEKVVLNDEQEKELAKLIRAPYEKSNTIVPNSNLIIILVESLESWALDTYDGYCYCPNMAMLAKSDHSFYCQSLKCQVLHGNSGDGQMICLTGILPIKEGATCVLYGTNHYPSIAESYPHSAIFSQDDSWKQSIVTYSYQFKELLMPPYSSYNTHNAIGDDNMMYNMEQYIDTVEQSVCIVGITGASHIPFRHGQHHPKHTIKDMPQKMQAYLNSLAFTDSCIGHLVDKIYSKEATRNTTILITGDHTVFRSEYEDINTYSREHGYTFLTPKTYTPLIIYSPYITNSEYVLDTCYQMDIYPTVLSVLGLDNYYWKGVGVNLRDSVAREKRIVDEESAYILSDWLIRSNYFMKYNN